MSEITLLPDDKFNVIVENEMDRLRLLWLVNKIGETKLRKSVAKYQNRYPESKPFVSLLLTWYRLKVPTSVYAPAIVPVYWLYILRLRKIPKIKIGITGRWPQRAFSFLSRAVEYYPDLDHIHDLFDLDTSVAFLVGGDKTEALRRERSTKARFIEWRVETPWRDGLIPYGASGHKEWFDASILEDVCAYVSGFDGDRETTTQFLSTALEILEREGDPTAPVWAPSADRML